MRKYITLILLFCSSAVYSQSKISYDLILTVSGVTNTSKPFQTTTRTAAPILQDTSGNWGTISLHTFNSLGVSKENSFTSKITSEITFGGRVSYPLEKNINITGGISLSFVSAKRAAKQKESSWFNVVDTSGGRVIIQGGYLVAISSIYSVRNFALGPNLNETNYRRSDNFNFIVLNIPLAVSYRFKKWQFETGITPAVILNTKENKEKPQIDAEISNVGYSAIYPYDPVPSEKNDVSMFVSWNLSPVYNLSKHVLVGLEYNQGLTKIFSSDVHESMKIKRLGIKMLYKL